MAASPTSFVPPRSCPTCGVVFTPPKRRQRYCSRRCSSRARTAKLREPRAAPAVSTSPLAEPRPPTPDRRGADPTPPEPLTPVEARLEMVYAERCAWLARGEYWRDEAARRSRSTRSRTLFLAGQGAYLGVKAGALVVASGRSYGAPEEREVLYPALHEVRRIIWLGGTRSSGTISLAALAWLRAEEVALLLLDQDGALTGVIGSEATADIRLRRAQYAAARNGQALTIAREILTRKVVAQQRVIETWRAVLPNAPRADEALGMARQWLGVNPEWLQSLEMVQRYEGRCARAYFGAWAGLAVRYRTEREAGSVPPHWRRVRERTSPLAYNDNGRHAVDPANALLNLGYAMLESQVRAALTTAGFDLACGLLHADKQGRDSMVYDAMEELRPLVDDRVLTFLTDVRFSKADFVQLPNGCCRLHSQLARAAVGVFTLPAQNVNDVIERLKRALLPRAGRPS